MTEAPGAVDGRRLGGRYRVGALLGAGGMGEVWAARDLPLDRPVAVKVPGAALAGDGRGGPPRRQAGQRVPDLRRRGEGPRLRDRLGGRRGRPHHRRPAGHGRLPGPRAGARPASPAADPALPALAGGPAPRSGERAQAPSAVPAPDTTDTSVPDEPTTRPAEQAEPPARADQPAGDDRPDRRDGRHDQDQDNDDSSGPGPGGDDSGGGSGPG